MKVCQINVVYGEGSTGKLVKVLHEQLQQNGHESVAVCSVRHRSVANVYGISNRFLSKASALYRRIFARQFDGAFLQTNRLLSILKREQPDVVHIHCINGNNINVYRLMRYLSKNKIPTVLTLHAEFPYTGGCAHAYDCEKWKTGCGNCAVAKKETQSVIFDGTAHTWRSQKACYDGFAPDKLSIVAVSPWLQSRAERSPMLSRFSHCSVLNGVDTSVFYRREPKPSENGEKIVFFATALFDTVNDNEKGGKDLLKLAERMKDKPVKFVVAANRSVVGELPDNVLFLGRTKTQDELAQWYSSADLTVILSKRETFSMPVAESLCCGTPVVGFQAGGPESIALPAYTQFVPYGDIDSLQACVDTFLERSFDAEDIAQTAQQRYSETRMYEDYEALYRELYC